MKTTKQGVKKGTVNNPRGVNQYAKGKGHGQKKSALYLRISESDKLRLKEAAQKKGMPLSSWLLQVALEAASSSSPCQEY